MTSYWYQKQRFSKDPLQIKPRFTDSFLKNDTLLEEIMYRVGSGTILCLQGTIGKTAALMQIIKKYRGKGKVMYVDYNTLKDEHDIKVILHNGKKSFLFKKPKRLPKGMIILMDNVSSISPDSAEQIKFLYDENIIQSIILTSTKCSEIQLPHSIKHRIGSRVYTLKNLTQHDIVDIINARLGDQQFILQGYIHQIVRHTKELKTAFEMTSEILTKMHDKELLAVTEELLQESLQEK